jgi:hypothetical protein
VGLIGVVGSGGVTVGGVGTVGGTPVGVTGFWVVPPESKAGVPPSPPLHPASNKKSRLISLLRLLNKNMMPPRAVSEK